MILEISKRMMHVLCLWHTHIAAEATAATATTVWVHTAGRSVAVACASAHLGLVYGMYTDLLAWIHQERHAQTSADTSRSPGKCNAQS
jgi:hypothetical protein